MIFLTYSHRLLPDSFAGDGLTAEEILKDLLEKVNVPVFSRASA